MIVIRTAHRNDADKIVEFQLKMAFETEKLELNKIDLHQGVTAVFEDASKGEYFVAESDESVIASLLITKEWSDWRNKTVYWIQSVYVIPEYRGKGVFDKMYNHIKSVVENSDNIAGIRLYVDKSNINAQKVYSKMGMTNHHYELFEWMK